MSDSTGRKRSRSGRQDCNNTARSLNSQSDHSDEESSDDDISSELALPRVSSNSNNASQGEQQRKQPPAAEQPLPRTSWGSSKKDHPFLKLAPPDWLYAIGEKRHSDQQLSSGADLSKTKKKYRDAMCTFCAAYNIHSPWAVLKSRKFEHAIFNKHEKSSHHDYAVQEMEKAVALGGGSIAIPIVKPEYRRLLDSKTTAAGRSKSEGPIKKRHKSGDITRNMKPPPWVQAVGEFCHSDAELASGKDLSNIRKKYKHLLCLYCAEYCPSSPWATLRPRKFDPEVWNEHQQSHTHVKAVSMRQQQATAAGTLNAVATSASAGSAAVAAATGGDRPKGSKGEAAASRSGSSGKGGGSAAAAAGTASTGTAAAGTAGDATTTIAGGGRSSSRSSKDSGGGAGAGSAAAGGARSKDSSVAGTASSSSGKSRRG